MDNNTRVGIDEYYATLKMLEKQDNQKLQLESIAIGWGCVVFVAMIFLKLFGNSWGEAFSDGFQIGVALICPVIGYTFLKWVGAALGIGFILLINWLCELTGLGETVAICVIFAVPILYIIGLIVRINRVEEKKKHMPRYLLEDYESIRKDRAEEMKYKHAQEEAERAEREEASDRVFDQMMMDDELWQENKRKY